MMAYRGGTCSLKIVGWLSRRSRKLTSERVPDEEHRVSQEDAAQRRLKGGIRVNDAPVVLTREHDACLVIKVTVRFQNEKRFVEEERSLLRELGPRRHLRHAVNAPTRIRVL